MRQLAGAFAERHGAWPPTAPPLSFRPVPHPTHSLLTRRHSRSDGRLAPPGRGGRTRTGRRALKTAKLWLRTCFPRSRGGGRRQAENRNLPRVGRFPSRGPNPSFEQPCAFARFVPISTAGTLRDQAFVVGPPVVGAQQLICTLQSLSGRGRLEVSRARASLVR